MKERRSRGSQFRRLAEHILLTIAIGLISGMVLAAYLELWPIFGI